MSNSGLEMNKIAAAIVLAGIVAMVAGLGSEVLYRGGLEHGKHGEEKRGYSIAGVEEAHAADGTSPAAAPAQPVDIKPFLAKADVAAGKDQLKKCTSCHTFDKGGKNGVGPNQWGLLGSHFGHKEDFAYSAAIQGKKDKSWNFQELSNFLLAPQQDVPGTKMAFAGVKNPQDRANLIAYLNTLSDNPLPLPK